MVDAHAAPREGSVAKRVRKADVAVGESAARDGSGAAGRTVVLIGPGTFNGRPIRRVASVEMPFIPARRSGVVPWRRARLHSVSPART